MMLVKAEPSDFEEILELLSFLPDSYPNAFTWLENRLQESFENKAYAYVLKNNNQIIGIVIGVVKAGNRFKISTLYVKEEYRGFNYGKVLLNKILAKATFTNSETVYITANENLDSSLGKMLYEYGFTLIAVKQGLYGKSSTEYVYSLELKEK